MPQELASPAVTLRNVRLPEVPDTGSGSARFVSVPSPSSPAKLLPQQYMTPLRAIPQV
jgi:hypothetical protein